MTTERYTAYRRVMQSLEDLPFRAGEREVLRDAAEAFLLARDEHTEELAEIGLAVSITLDQAVRSRRVTRRAANALALAIEASGPQGAVLLAA